MTQKNLMEKLEKIEWERVSPSDGRDKILELINQHVKEVIGEDDEPVYSKVGDSTTEVLGTRTRNDLRAEQRKRAGL